MKVALVLRHLVAFQCHFLKYNYVYRALLLKGILEISTFFSEWGRLLQVRFERNYMARSTLYFKKASLKVATTSEHV